MSQKMCLQHFFFPPEGQLHPGVEQYIEDINEGEQYIEDINEGIATPPTPLRALSKIERAP
jgi:hypothetical protein